MVFLHGSMVIIARGASRNVRIVRIYSLTVLFTFTMVIIILCILGLIMHEKDNRNNCRVIILIELDNRVRMEFRERRRDYMPLYVTLLSSSLLLSLNSILTMSLMRCLSCCLSLLSLLLLSSLLNNSANSFSSSPLFFFRASLLFFLLSVYKVIVAIIKELLK